MGKKVPRHSLTIGGNSPGTEVLNGVLERDRLGDRDTVLGDLGSAERLACGVVSGKLFSGGSEVEKKAAGRPSELGYRRSIQLSTRTDDDGAALGAESSLDGLGEGVDTLQHALAGVVAEDDILGTKVAAGGGLRVEQARGTGERGARASKHCGGVGNAFCGGVRKERKKEKTKLCSLV